jgi:hypothetical protein
MQFQLIGDWAAGSNAWEYIPNGEVLDGIVDGNGNLTGIRWHGQSFGSALPREATALDQAAADELSRQHPEALYLLRALPPAVMRAVVNV